MKARPPLYIFNWPSNVGGADTKVTHLLLLLHRDYDITMVPNTREQLLQLGWRKFLKRLGVKAALWSELPKKLNGGALSLCNGRFLGEGTVLQAKQRGLRVIWSSEMMWHHGPEIAAVAFGVIDKVLYVSEMQKQLLAPGYGKCPSAITGNYIDPSFFPFSERPRAADAPLVIGRLSRPDPAKFPPDFPEFYESLDLGRAALPRRRTRGSVCATIQTKFRVMAWSEELAQVYARHRFDARWDLLAKEAESQVQFLHSLDLFVYSLGPNFRESWGRSTVEAMLTGAVPLVPKGGGHHLENMVPHGKAGFVCANNEDYREHVQRLRKDVMLRKKFSRAARRHAENELCNRAEHLRVWLEALGE